MPACAASPDRVQAMVGGAGHLDVLDPAQVYWAGRLTLCADPDDLARYDAAFAAYFGGQLPPARSARRHTAAGPPWLVDPRSPDGADGTDDGEDVGRTPTGEPQEVLRRRDVAELTRRRARGAAPAVRPADPGGRAAATRRYALRAAACVDLERTVRRMLGAGGEPSRLARRDRRTKPRRLVLLIDVSGSMAPYADALLRFAHAAMRVARTTPRSSRSAPG